MNFFAHHQQQNYDPSSQTQESYNQFNSYSQSYAYPNPQFTSTIHPYSYQTPSVQPSPHQEQEPNPPGVSPPPLPETYRNSYYQYNAYGAAAGDPAAGPQPGVVDAAVHTVVHQPIVPSVYGGVGMMDGTVPRGDPQPHLGSNPNVSSSTFLVNGGHALPMYTATPFQDQTVTAYGGLHFQGGPYQHPSQSYAEPYHGPTHTPKVPGPVSRARGHAKGRVQQKHAVAPAQDPKLGASSFSQTQLLPLKAPAPVLPPPKGVTCELCKVECNTLEVLQQHVNGKKHMKKLKVFEELQNLSKKVLSVQPEQAPTTELKPELVSQPDRVEGSGSQQLHQEAPPSQEINTESTKVAGEKRKAEEVEPSEESGKMMKADGPENSRRGPKHKLKGSKGKKKKTKPSKGLVQASKPKEVTPLVCELCDVKCESVVVFQSHLAGKKHRLKAKCFLQGQETFGLEQRPVIQAVNQNNAGASTFVSFQLVDQGFGVAAVQNGNMNSGHGSTLGDNTRSSEVEAISTINQT